jgi:phenylacetate-CoA ligase
MVLKAEAGEAATELPAILEQALQASTKMKGRVEIVPPDSLPNDGKVIADERPAG